MDKLIARIEDVRVVVDRSVLASPLRRYKSGDPSISNHGNDDYCIACGGTGENQFDAGRCGACNGTGFFNSTKGNL